jgi:Bacterial PH domain
VGLTLLMLGVAVTAFAMGVRWPALFALLVALIPWTAWRMSGDLDPLWLDLERNTLILQLRRRRLRHPLAGAEARRLTPEETTHLERLATTGGVVVGTGGFDSRLLGEFELYASDLANAVLLDLGETRLVLTPDEPDRFVAALTSPP